MTSGEPGIENGAITIRNVSITSEDADCVSRHAATWQSHLSACSSSRPKRIHLLTPVPEALFAVARAVAPT